MWSDEWRTQTLWSHSFWRALVQVGAMCCLGFFSSTTVFEVWVQPTLPSETNESTLLIQNYMTSTSTASCQPEVLFHWLHISQTNLGTILYIGIILCWKIFAKTSGDLNGKMFAIDRFLQKFATTVIINCLQSYFSWFFKHPQNFTTKFQFTV